MPTCPRCRQTLTADAITCPQCRLVLKAHGHPGIPLHRASGDSYLCDTCIYHFDDSCTFPQWPTAQTCTLYQDVNVPQPSLPIYRIPWWRQYSSWLVLAVLIVVSLAIALL
jgi:hypothetical protein